MQRGLQDGGEKEDEMGGGEILRLELGKQLGERNHRTVMSTPGA